MALLSLLFCSQEIQVIRASHSGKPILSSIGSIPLSPPTSLPAEVCHDPSAHFLKSGWCWQVSSAGQCGSGWRWVGASFIQLLLTPGFSNRLPSQHKAAMRLCVQFRLLGGRCAFILQGHSQGKYQSKQYTHMHTHTQEGQAVLRGDVV